MPEATVPTAALLVGCAITGCSRRLLATRLARQAYRRHRSTMVWKASCVVGSLWAAMLAGAITALAAALLKPLLALSAGPDLLVPLLVGIIAASATEAFRFRGAYWTVVHDSLKRGLSDEEKRESGFNGTHNRLTNDSEPEEKRIALERILSAELPAKPSKPPDAKVPGPGVFQGKDQVAKTSKPDSKSD